MGNLEKLGYSSWFENHTETEKVHAHELARVISVHKDSCVVTKGDGEVLAQLSGHLSYTIDSASDLPTTGDWVYADFYDDDTHAIIHDVVPRKTLLKRKTAGKSVDFQLIAANIDVAFIVQSVDYNFNLSRMERYLVMVNEGGITPVILLSKSDLISIDELKEIKQSVNRIASQAMVYEFSNVSGKNLDAIKDSLLPGYSYCLLGSSGVGKTTLLNGILGKEKFETKSVSKKENKGRHTTTRRELIQLDNGEMIIDTPGMRELGNMSVNAGINETFYDILNIARECKFGNCSHTSEKGCAVLAAIQDGEISDKRYKNYIKMKNESEFNDMSYFERRKKDKAFGKLIKSTMKEKNKRV